MSQFKRNSREWEAAQTVVISDPAVLKSMLKQAIREMVAEGEFGDKTADWMNAAQTADFLKTSVGKVYEMANAGTLPYKRFGVKTMSFNKSEVNAALAKIQP